MTPVRIAAEVTASGVGGERWVLIDAAQGDLRPPQPSPTAGPDVAEPPTRRARLLWPLKLALLAAGLGLAWAATHVSATRGVPMPVGSGAASSAVEPEPAFATAAAPPPGSPAAGSDAQWVIVSTRFGADAQPQAAAPAPNDQAFAR